METRRITYTPQGGVCSKLMVIDAKDGVIENVQIVGGCHGNGQGMCALLKGMRIEDAYRSFVWHRLSWKGNFMPGPDGTGIEAIQSMISLYPIPRIFKILIDSSFDNL
ncbi:TSCPD domain-containing protein [Parabacteroides distasonis]|nr:TSCPD domain-containing protein [Parabacteroides distasonis]